MYGNLNAPIQSQRPRRFGELKKNNHKKKNVKRRENVRSACGIDKPVFFMLSVAYCCCVTAEE